MQKDNLSVQHTLKLVAGYYKNKKSIGFRTLEDHCRRVANLSQNIALRLFSDMKGDAFSGDTQENVEAVVHAGLLHPSINVGACTFEEIAEHTTVQVADMVANISRDYRLIETKRDLEFRGRISQSSVATQIVALADVICTTKEILDTITKTGLASIPRPRKILIRLDADLLSLHATSRYYTLRLYAHAAKNLLIDTGQLLKDKKKELRNAKAARTLAVKIQNKIAAKRAATEASPDPVKRRNKNG